MKPLRYILFFLLIVSPPRLWAQYDDFNKFMEKNIKTSGKYYYGDGSDKNEANAQAIAVEELKMMIDEKMKSENPGVEKVIFSNSLDKNVMYIKFTSMGRVRMVAYILKEQLTKDIANANITVGAKGGQLPVTGPAVPEFVSQYAEQVLKDLIPLKKSADAQQYLNVQKNKGTLMLGRISTLQAAQNCYFIIIRGGEVVDILDKGDSPTRKGLVTGNQTDYTSVPEGEIYWIFIF